MQQLTDAAQEAANHMAAHDEADRPEPDATEQGQRAKEIAALADVLTERVAGRLREYSLTPSEIQAAERTVAAQLLNGRRGSYAEVAAAEVPEPERQCFVFRRLEPVEYTLYAQSQQEAEAILADKGGAAASDRNAVDVQAADELEDYAVSRPFHLHRVEVGDEEEV